MRHKLFSGSACLLVGLLYFALAAGQVHAANVHMIRGAGTGNTGVVAWDNPLAWDNNAAPSPDNDYWVGKDENGTTITMATDNTSGNIYCRPTIGTTFGGRSLHLTNYSGISVRPAAGGSTYTIDDLQMTTGTINNHNSATTNVGIFKGNITISGGRIDFRSSGSGDVAPGRSLEFQSNIKGTASSIRLYMSPTNIITLSGNNTFTVGLLEINGPSGTTVCGTANIAGTAALGNPARLMTKGILVPTAAIVAPNTDLDIQTGGVVTLQSNVEFKTCKVNGSYMAPGTYTFATLPSAVAASFATGPGTLKVNSIPPVLSAAPASVTFVPVNVQGANIPTTASVVITNTGTGTVTFTGGAAGTPGMALAGTSPTDFLIVSETPANTTSLAAGASVTVLLKSKPAGTAIRNNIKATLHVTSDDPGGALDIPLTGDAVPVQMSRFRAE